ncbi:MAG: sulfurtransferase TusA family protein [Gammaproteobacteria bacterium]|nr:sulfurtransferase TusA family protein [Gammaproteobacteria bacterium]
MNEDSIVDAKGQNCPMPLLMAKRALNQLDAGQFLRVYATDPGSVKDFRVFSEQSGHHLLESEESEGIYSYLLEKKR